MIKPAIPSNNLIISLFAILTLIFSNAEAAVLYSVTDLMPGYSGLVSRAVSINDAGQAIGNYGQHHFGEHAFLTQNNHVQTLDALDGRTVNAINSQGQIVGYRPYDPFAYPGVNRGFSYSSGLITEFGTLGGACNRVSSACDSRANAINDNGQVVGSSHINSFLPTQRGFATTVQGPLTSNQSIGVLAGGQQSGANAINNAGQIAGWSETATGNHAFVSQNGIMIDLGTLGGFSSEATAINDGGQVAGYSYRTDNNWASAFVTVNGTMVDIGTLGLGSIARGINNGGQVVGSVYTSTIDTFAFATVNGVMTDLNTLIAANSGWFLREAYDVNNNGQIVGIGHGPLGSTRAFLLTPIASVPLPSSFGLFASILIGWRGLKGRKALA